MAVDIRLMLKVDRDKNAISNAQSLVDDIAKMLPKAIGNALTNVDATIKNIISVLGTGLSTPFTAALGEVGKFNTAITNLSTNVAALVTNLGGIKLPAGIGGGLGGGAGGTGGTGSTGPSQASLAAIEALKEQIRDMGLRPTGLPRPGTITKSGQVFEIPMISSDKLPYTMRVVAPLGTPGPSVSQSQLSGGWKNAASIAEAEASLASVFGGKAAVGAIGSAPAGASMANMPPDLAGYLGRLNEMGKFVADVKARYPGLSDFLAKNPLSATIAAAGGVGSSGQDLGLSTKAGPLLAGYGPNLEDTALHEIGHNFFKKNIVAAGLEKEWTSLASKLDPATLKAMSPYPGIEKQSLEEVFAEGFAGYLNPGGALGPAQTSHGPRGDLPETVRAFMEQHLGKRQFAPLGTETPGQLLYEDADPNRVRPTSEGLIAPETARRAHQQMADFFGIGTDKAWEQIAQSGPKFNQTGELFTRDYKNPLTGEIYRARIRQLAGEEQFRDAAPLKSAASRAGGINREEEEQLKNSIKRFTAAFDSAVASFQNEKNIAAIKGTGGIWTPGYRRTGANIGPDGQPISEQFSRAAGLFTNASSASVNAQTGAKTEQIKQQSSALWQLWNRFRGDGGAVNQVFTGLGNTIKGAFAPLTGILHTWERLGNEMIRVSAIFYSFERIGRIIERATLGPYEKIIAAGEEAMKFRMAISGTVGGMGNAAAIDDQMAILSRSLPITLEQTRQLAKMMVDVTSLAPHLALAGPEGAGNLVGGFADIITRLSIANPQVSQEQIAKTVDNALLGNLRGLRLSARIDPNDLAYLSGRTQKELAGDQSLMLQTIARIARSRVSDQTVREREQLPSVQWEKFKDQFTIAMQRIAIDSGLMTTVADRFHQMMEDLGNYIDTPEFRSKARAIGEDLSHIFKNVLDAGSVFLQKLVGANAPAKSPETITDYIEQFTHALSMASNILPDIAGRIGGALSYIVTGLGAFLAKLEVYGAKIGDREGGSWTVGGGLEFRNSQKQATADLFNQLFGRNVVDVHSAATIQVQADRFAGDLFGDGGYRSPSGKMGAMWNTVKLGATGNLTAEQKMLSISPKEQEFGDFLRKAVAIVERLDLPVREGKLVGAGELLLPEIRSLAAQNGIVLRGLPRLNDDAKMTAEENRRADSLRESDRAFNKLNIGEMAGQPTAPLMFDAMFRAISSEAGKLMESVKEEKFDKGFNDMAAFEQMNFRFKTNLWDVNEKPRAMDDEVRRKVSEFTGQLTQRRGGLYDVLVGLDIETPEADHVRDQIDQINKVLNNLGAGLEGFLKHLAEARRLGTEAWTIEQIESLKGKNPLFAGAQAELLISGGLGVQAEMGFDRKKGISGRPIDEQLGAYQAVLAAKLARDKAMGDLGMIPEGGSLLFGRGGQNVAGMQLSDSIATRQQLMAVQQQAMTQLNDVVGSGTPEQIDRAKAKLLEATTAVQMLDGEIRKLQLQTNVAMQGFIDFGNSSQQSIEKSLGTAMSDLITKTGKLSDVFKSLGREIVNSFSQMASHTLINSIMGEPSKTGTSGGGGLMNGLFGLFGLGIGGGQGNAAKASNGSGSLVGGVGASAIGGAGNIVGGILSSIFGLFAEDGAVWPGWTPFAGGGIVKKPTLGLIGERRDGVSESVIPMLGPGRSIPLGIDGNGVHAILPGGRKIAASFADGGITSGFTAFANGGVMGGGGVYRGSSSRSSASDQGVELHIVNLADRDEFANYAVAKHGKTIKNDVLAEFRNGGRGRQMLDKRS